MVSFITHLSLKNVSDERAQAELALMNCTLAALTLTLKPQQLGAFSMLSHQSFPQWQQSPIKGAIPSVPSDSDHLEIIQDNLLDAISNLQFCHTYLENSGLSKRYSQLFTAVVEALNSTNQAITHCETTEEKK